MSDTNASDSELLRRARRDPAAFCEFYDRHAVALHAWLARELRDPQVAFDLTAETFAQALSGLRGFRGEHEGSGRAWLYAIARHLLARHRSTGRLESRARERLGIPLFEPDAAEDVQDRIAGESVGHDLRNALEELPAEQRDAVQLRVVDGLPYAAVAAELGCSAAAARIRVSRGLRKLGRLLEGAQP